MLRLEVRVLPRGYARSHATLLPGNVRHISRRLNLDEIVHIRNSRHQNLNRDVHRGGRASTTEVMLPLPMFDKRHLAMSLPGSGCKLRRSRRRHGLHL